MSNYHEYTEEIFLVKDFKPKYSTIEVLFTNCYCTWSKSIGLMNWQDFKRKYADGRIMAVEDLDHVKRTSIALDWL